MKKILFLLLSTVSIYGQVSTGQEQEFDYGIKNNSAQTVTTANHLTTTGADGTQGKILPSSLPISTAVANALDLRVENSAGAIQGFAITDNGNGTVNIATGTAYLRTTNDPYAPLIKYVIPSVTNLALTDNANNFVLVDYNLGTPALTVSVSPGTVNTMTNSIAYVISRVGTTLDYVSLIGQNIDANGKLRRRFLNSEGLKRASGAVLSGLNRNLILTGGLYYSGLIEVPTPSFNTSTSGTFTQAYLNGGSWVRTTGNTQINNTQYSLAGVLTTMPSNDYRVDYVYILADNPSKLYVLLGNTTYNNIGSARLAPVPSDLPSELQFLGTRVGRIIIQKDALTMEVSSEFATIYQAGSAQLHNDLAGLNAGDFQHLTVAEKASIALKAPLASPALTGTPTAPTAAAGTNTTQIATTAFVTSADANNVKLTGNQTVSGVKTFNDKILVQGVEIGSNRGTGQANTYLGKEALLLNTTGERNTALGQSSLLGNTTLSDNTSVGFQSLFAVTGEKNTTIGSESGRFILGGADLTSSSNSIFIGYRASAKNNGETNQIAIGTIGEGSNTATLGNTSITQTILRGTVTTNGAFVNSSAPATNALLANGTTLANPISGTGTTNFLPKFTSSGVIGNSQIFDNGTNIGIGLTPVYKFDVAGSISSTSIGNPAIKFNSTFDEITNRNWDFISNLTAFGEFDLRVSTASQGFPTISVLNFKSNGALKLPNLAGTGTRTVVASSTGELSTLPNSNARSVRFELSADVNLPVSTTGSVSVVDFDSSVFNIDNTLFTNNGAGVITCTQAGIYLVTTSLVIESPLASALTKTEIGVRKNGTTILCATTDDSTLALGNNIRSLTTTTIINLNANDTLATVVNLFGADATGRGVRVPSLFGTTLTQVSNISIQKLER